MQDQLARLQSVAAGHAKLGHTTTSIPRLVIGMSPEPTPPFASIYEPMLCLVLQGAKEVLIGDRRLRYDPATCFVASLALPASGRIVQASRDRPYLSVSLALDRKVLAELLADAPAKSETNGTGFGIGPVTPAVLDAWYRFLQLLDAPQDIAVLAPLIEREILYRLLGGPQGGVLRQVVTADARLLQIHQAINWIRTHYGEPMRIDTLSKLAGMSAASFHRHFKAVTTMSPLQYQKHLRLQHARRLLITNEDAARAAFAVGYESASQFSREYARLFGAPPARDALRLQRDVAALQVEGTIA
ncbi:MAG TPA: AraC family transcriptional regulator [Rhizomicrobium sp.]|nr:AraC family transcriptional regulator [Rhizomicrobium sp.]